MTANSPRAASRALLSCWVLGFLLAPSAALGAAREPTLQAERQREAVDAEWEERIAAPTEQRAAAPPAFPAGVSVRLPAEFETQHALLVACHNMIWDEPELFADLVAAARPRVEIVAAVRNVAEYRLALKLLEARKIPTERVHFAEFAHDTMWTRDYGPMIAQRFDGRPLILDAAYSPHVRPDDDAFPQRIARSLDVRVLRVPLLVDGGNLLGNGQGLMLTTQNLLLANLHAKRSEPEVRRLLREYYGATHVEFLEPLAGEPTGHVDMFATFVTPNTVVVGAYDPRLDPTNAQILDRNAERLARLRTARGPLRVVRVPMPPNQDHTWRSYTNVVYANGVLLMPSFPELDPSGQKQAAAIYRRLLPDWKIVPIDARKVSQHGGALHCVTMNLGVIRTLPKFPPPRQIEATTDPLLATGRARSY